MPNNLLSLAARVRKLRGAIPEAVNERTKQIALTLASGLPYATPVDTSQALSNWDVTLDAPTVGKHGPHYPGSKGSTYSASAAAAVELAKVAISKRKIGQPIYITNNQQYIVYLNQGSSAQAPAKFVQTEIAKAVRNGKFKLKVK